VGKTKGIAHLEELVGLARKLEENKSILDNALRLATRYEGLFTVLLVSSDKADKERYEAMRASSTALKLLDESLALTFAGQQSVDITIIPDRRPFRGVRIRETESEEERQRNNQTAYAGFEAVLAELHPKAIGLCQYEDTALEDCGRDQWSSSVSRAGRHDIITLPNKRKSL